MLHSWFDALCCHNAKQHEFPRVGACWFRTNMAPTCARNPADDAKQHELSVFGGGGTRTPHNLFCHALRNSSETQRIQRVLAMLVDSGRMLEPCWNTKWDCQHAPTRENSNVFYHEVEEWCCIFGSTHWVSTTRNSMNFHVLAHVGGAILTNQHSSNMRPQFVRSRKT